MSGALRSLALKNCQLAVSRWPADPLRPDVQLHNVLAKRLEASRLAPNTEGLSETAKQEADLRQANALLGLLDNRYKNRHRLTSDILKPASNPTYYNDLLVELEEAPKRSWLDRLGKRLGGMIRLS